MTCIYLVIFLGASMRIKNFQNSETTNNSNGSEKMRNLIWKFEENFCLSSFFCISSWNCLPVGSSWHRIKSIVKSTMRKADIRILFQIWKFSIHVCKTKVCHVLSPNRVQSVCSAQHRLSPLTTSVLLCTDAGSQCGRTSLFRLAIKGPN